MSENQTLFTEEKPLNQEIYMPSDVNQDEGKTTFLKTKKGKITLAIVGTFVLLILVTVALLPRNPVAPEVQPSPSPTAAPLTTSAMQQRLIDLEEELKRADPADSILPFPAVDMYLELEPEED